MWSREDCELPGLDVFALGKLQRQAIREKPNCRECAIITAGPYSNYR